MLESCAKHGIGPDWQLIEFQDIDDAYSKVEKREVRFRYVIDMASHTTCQVRAWPADKGE